MTACFWIEPTGRCRSYAVVDCPACGVETTVEERIGPVNEDAEPGKTGRYDAVKLDRDDVAWPERCPNCDAEFDYDEEPEGLGGNIEWHRPDTGDTRWGPHDFGPGAMWDAPWMRRKKPDGRYLVVITPDGHEWNIDSQANNCKRPGEDHDCWCRHGEPPNLTVDSIPEPGRTTCDAGAGSIQTGSWHGFLRDGHFIPV